jgi:hypothetical protein
MQLLISNIDALCEQFIEADAQSIYNNQPGTYTLVSGKKVKVSISKGIANFDLGPSVEPVKAPKKRGKKTAENSPE